MWTCEHCARTFANRNQTHSCRGRTAAPTLDAHFASKPPLTRELFDAFARAIRRLGPVDILPEKTRIAFHVRMSFAVLMPRKGYLKGHLVLAERHENPCFLRVETYSPRNHVHTFELRSQDGLKGDLAHYLALAYKVGNQEHLQTSEHKPNKPARKPRQPKS